MSNIGPCGPSSEIHIDIRSEDLSVSESDDSGHEINDPKSSSSLAGPSRKKSLKSE